MAEHNRYLTCPLRRPRPGAILSESLVEVGEQALEAPFGGLVRPLRREPEAVPEFEVGIQEVCLEPVDRIAGLLYATTPVSGQVG